MTESSIIFARALDKPIQEQGLDDIESIKNYDGPAWVHLDAGDEETAEAVRKISSPPIDEQSLAALLDTDARPRLLALEHGTLVILRGINHNEGDEPEDMVAVRLWITEKRLISVRYRRSKALMDVAKSLEISSTYKPKTVGDIFAQLCSALFAFIEINISHLFEKLDEIESQVLDTPDRHLRQNIADIRKSSIMLRRYIAPQKDAINQLRFAELPWLSAKNIRRIHEAQDALLRNIEDLDAIRERSQVVKDELVNALSDRLNRNLYLLSVITAIFLPLGFLTGLFGINIGGMPGVDSSNAFAIFCGGLVIIVIIQVLLFKKLSWF